MCARITQELDFSAVSQLLNLDDQQAAPARTAAPRWNGPPGAAYLVAARSGLKSPTELASMHWGLVPNWSRDDKFQAVNARSETLASRPSFREAFRSRRAIFPVTGWFEWGGPRERRQPYYIHRPDGGLMLLAALWEPQRPGGCFGRTFTVVTTTPRPEIARLHDRQPTVLDSAEAMRWLGTASSPAELEQLARTNGSEPFEWQAVSRRVNSPANAGPDLLVGIDQRATA